MPLFNFKCTKCNNIFEKFVHCNDESKILCEKCCGECNKLIGAAHNRKRMSAAELLSEKINPEIDRITEKIQKGSDKDFLDLCGEE